MLKKKIFTLVTALIFGFSLIPATATFADDGGASADVKSTQCSYLLGMPAWNCFLDLEKVDSEDDLSYTIWQIVANIATDLSIIATYLAIGYVIYGGYKYMFASGDVSKVAAGKRTLNQAFIGLAITMSASLIMNTIRVVMAANNFGCDPINDAGQIAQNGCIDSAGVTTMVTDIINWVIGIGGTVALIFVIGGGISYITSSGDPQKLTQAKNMIKYALIGLVIVALAEGIVIFMTNVIPK